MIRPKNCKKCGGRMKQQGGLQLYTQSNTPQGAITPTGRSNRARMSPEQIQALASQFGFRTDTNENLQTDLFNYARKNQPDVYNRILGDYGETASGSFIDGLLGARTSDLLQGLGTPSSNVRIPMTGNPAAPTMADLTENLYGPNKVLLGRASQRYRDSQDITDPGVVNPEYVDFQFYQPNTANLTGDRYRIPYDTYLNQITRGTTTVFDPSQIGPQYLYSSSTAANKQFGGPMDTQKKIKMNGGYLKKMQPGGNMTQQYINQGIIADPRREPLDMTPMNMDITEKIPNPGGNNNPYQTLQNIGLGMRAGRLGLGLISGAIERGRQNQYDYMQQSALGQMNPMQADDFQPNPYNLYMQMGGNLNHIMRDYNKYSNDAQFDFGSGDNDQGMMSDYGIPEGYHVMPDGRLMKNSDMNYQMKKGGYEIDRMLIVRKLLPELLKLGRLGSGKYRNYKKGGIHIKPENRGKFTDYCGGKVTDECIQKGLHSSNPTTRKRANFARNARKWN